jgi:Ketopantoate reductase PanE/ApbA
VSVKCRRVLDYVAGEYRIRTPIQATTVDSGGCTGVMDHARLGSSRIKPRDLRVLAVMPDVPVSNTNFFQMSRSIFSVSVMSKFAASICSARGAHRDAIRRDGLKIESALGDLHLKEVNVTDDPTQVGPVDVVLFAVKLWDTETAGEQTCPLLGPESRVITLQNGVDSVERLAPILGEEAVIAGTTYVVATIDLSRAGRYKLRRRYRVHEDRPPSRGIQPAGDEPQRSRCHRASARRLSQPQLPGSPWVRT